MATKKLPFKVSPKGFQKISLGNDSIGVLEVAKYEDLTPNERIFIKQNTEGFPSIQEETLKLAKNIAKDSGLKTVEVYNAFSRGDTELLQDYLSDFLKLQDIQRDVLPQEIIVKATAIIKFRIFEDWELADTGNPDLIHPFLVKEIAAFAGKELNGWGDEIVPVTEEDLKKSSEEKTTKLTGQKSTGE